MVSMVGLIVVGADCIGDQGRSAPRFARGFSAEPASSWMPPCESCGFAMRHPSSLRRASRGGPFRGKQPHSLHYIGAPPGPHRLLREASAPASSGVPKYACVGGTSLPVGSGTNAAERPRPALAARAPHVLADSVRAASSWPEHCRSIQMKREKREVASSEGCVEVALLKNLARAPSPLPWEPIASATRAAPRRASLPVSARSLHDPYR